MSSDMPLLEANAAAAAAAAAASVPILPSKPFFDPSNQTSWISVSSAPPAGAWQLAPSGISNPFAGGGALLGDAVYSTRDRKMTRANGPVIVTYQPDVIEAQYVKPDNALDTKLFRNGRSDEHLTIQSGTVVCMFNVGRKKHLFLAWNPASLENFMRNLNPRRLFTVGIVATDVQWQKYSEESVGDTIPIIVQGQADMLVRNHTLRRQNPMKRAESKSIFIPTHPAAANQERVNQFKYTCTHEYSSNGKDKQGVLVSYF